MGWKTLGNPDGNLCGCAESEARWFPVKVDVIKKITGAVFPSDWGRRLVYEIGANVTYNLQYCQYLSRSIRDGMPTSVLQTQQIKTYVVTVCGVIEGVIEFVLRDRHGLPEKKHVKASELPKLCEKHGLELPEGFFDRFGSLLNYRNRVHVQKAKGGTPHRDTQYNAFEMGVFNDASELLKEFLTGPLFPNASKHAKAIELLTA